MTIKRIISAALLASLSGSALVHGAPAPGVVGFCGTGLPDLAAPADVARESLVEVVFVLDTTGSMSGLIDGAKRKIWSIAGAISTAQPRPTVRLGLVAYRDRGDDYVTKITPLSEDLDAVYADLTALAANGGGDTPESVNQGLHDALQGAGWSDVPPGPGVLRLIYLVGDCPPHMDYADDVKYPETVSSAVSRGIVVNAVQCGPNADTAEVWRAIARAGEGEYFQIEQDGGMAAVATPMDEEITRLGRELSGTLLFFGDAGEQAAQMQRQAQGEAVVRSVAPEAAADRAVYNASPAGAANLTGGGRELVQALAEGSVRLDELPEEDLPGAVRDLPAEQRGAYVEQQAARRAQIQAKLQELGVQRQAFIDAQASKAGADGFDALVRESLARLGKARGILLGPREE